MDVDGTLTDGKIYMGPNGELMKAFNIKDGYGIHDLLIPNGIIPVIITGRSSSIVGNRCRELGISILYQGVKDKLAVLSQFISDKNANLSNIAYIGDDLNDISCIDAIASASGLIGCPADADAEVRDKSNFICPNKGGDGAVRDFINWILNRKG